MVGCCRGEKMGTLYQESPLHRSVRLATGGFSVSDYIKKFAAKDDSEEKESKPKHVLASRGSQVNVQRAPATPQKSSSSDDRRLSQKTAQCSSHHTKAESTDVQTLDLPRHPDSTHNAKPWAQKVAGELPGEKIAHTDSEGQYSQPCPTLAEDQNSKLEEPKKIIEEPGGDIGLSTGKPSSATCLPAVIDHTLRKAIQTEEISNLGTTTVPENEQKSDVKTPALGQIKTHATTKHKKTSVATQTVELPAAGLGKETRNVLW